MSNQRSAQPVQRDQSLDALVTLCATMDDQNAEHVLDAAVQSGVIRVCAKCGQLYGVAKCPRCGSSVFEIRESLAPLSEDDLARLWGV